MKRRSMLFSAIISMTYARFVKDNLPIGSGVTEAACKTVIKQRM